MAQNVEVYLKSIEVKENGFWKPGAEAYNVFVATWKQPNFINTEVNAAGKTKLKDGEVTTFPKAIKWRLFKLTVDGSSEIEFVVSGGIKVKKVIKLLAKGLGNVFSGIVPVGGDELKKLFEEIGDNDVEIGKGTFTIPADKPLKSGIYEVDLKAPKDLKVNYRESSGGGVGVLKSKIAVKKGKINGRMILDLRVV